MGYFNYHSTAKKLISQNKLLTYYFTDDHNGIKPALVLVFNDPKHPVMPIRKSHWEEYISLIEDKSSK
ncbi:MAG: thermostable hemolysin delta-VPH [Clostridia bacterium]|nr:thermostable hemolysin delta-VPH [Clostridia bacterium]MBQ3597268.1 thermostable hemolysin delta-VPH [Clostridia bacterium]